MLASGDAGCHGSISVKPRRPACRGRRPNFKFDREQQLLTHDSFAFFFCTYVDKIYYIVLAWNLAGLCASNCLQGRNAVSNFSNFKLEISHTFPLEIAFLHSTSHPHRVQSAKTRQYILHTHVRSSILFQFTSADRRCSSTSC